ncbi:Phage integrase family site specific recombinase [Pseudomonas syringae pv. pisi]|nr:Phage integrase family site specific recombinase [Pseudomonas syringae pv. pisi]
MHGVARPKVETNEGKTPALGDDQAKRLLDAPDAESLQGVRDRAILAVLLYQGLRREELSLLQTGDLQERRGVKHLRIHGKGGKIRYLPLHPVAAERIYVYLVRDGDRALTPGALFRSQRGKTSGTGITGKAVMSTAISDPSDIKLNARALVSWALIVLPKPTASVPNDSSVPYVFLK